MFSEAPSIQKRTHLVRDQLLLHDSRVLFERDLCLAGSELAQAGWPVIWDREQSEKPWRFRVLGASFRRERELSRWRRQSSGGLQDTGLGQP